MPSIEHLQRELNELRKQYDLLSEKISRLREAHVIAAGVTIRFELEIQIKQAEAERDKIEEQIQNLEAKIKNLRTQSKPERSPVPPERPPVPPNGIRPLHLLIVLFFNLVGLVALAVFFGINIPSRCVSPVGVGLSLAIVALELFHLTWRYLGETLLSLVIRIESLEIPIGQLAAFFERLHPRDLRDDFLWTQALFFFVIAGFLWFSPWSPFSNPEPAPNIQNFLVRHTGGDVETYALSGLLQLERDTNVLVEARVSDQPDISCIWSTTKGTLLPATGCAVQYSTPVEGNRDTLTILVQSPCKKYQAFASLNIEIGR
jgi:hypothetical protein